ncbi:MAG: AAA family ATPase [Actinobacteria bacterium]|nr:AAA family ATPase [Actinomycetota bacterium]
MSARRERKVVTVLFADLVGFTSRAESLDPEDVEAILRPYHERLRSELERYGGTVEKFIGDAVMALFGAPTAHEDDPERAIRAALAIRDWAVEEGELEVRIGITTGEALVSLDARPDVGEGMASGDVVNSASRLESAAPENGVLVDETTYRATQLVIDYRAADPVEAKGKVEPIPVWEAVEAKSRFGTDIVQSGASLVGRGRELDLLLGAFSRARSEHEPQLVTLVGVPGIGKSRLVFELFQQGVEPDPELIYWRQGRCLPYGEGVTYWAVSEMVKAQAGILDTDSADQAAEKLVQAVQSATGGDAAWVEPHLRPLVGLGEGVERSEDRHAEAHAAWRRFFEGLAQQRPLVLVFEDLHWADEGLLDFVDHLVEWASGVPLLVLCTGRPELLDRRPGWGGGKLNATTLGLSPLSDADTARLVAELTGQAVLPAETQAALLSRAGGNPLYAEQYARILAERGSVEDMPLPENVQGLIAARLDLLLPEEKALLQDAAVIGKVFWPTALTAVGDHDSIEESLHALERKEFVQRQQRSSVGGENEYAFRHLLVRDVAYGQIPRARRGEAHRRTAEWIESFSERADDFAEMLAHHYLAALELAQATGNEDAVLAERARAALREAGDRASSLSALEAAARFYARALELSPGDEERADLLFRYGRAEFWHSEQGGAEAFEQALAHFVATGDLERAAEAESLLAGLAQQRGQHDNALERHRRATRLIETTSPSRSKTFVLANFARFLMVGADPEAIRVAQEALEMAEALDLQELRAFALNMVGTTRVIIDADREGLDDLEQALAIALEANSPVEIIRTYNNLASSYVDLGDLRRGFEFHTSALEAAERFGNIFRRRWTRAELVMLNHLGGRWDDAVRGADDFLVEAEAGSPHYMEAPCRSTRGTISIARGDVDGGLDDTAGGLECARAIKDPQVLYPALSSHAAALVSVGRLTDAAPVVDELLGEWRAGTRRYLPASWAPPLAASLGALGRDEDFLEAARGAHARTRWLDAAELFAAGDFVGAADVYAEIGTLPDEAHARLRSGRESEIRRALEFYRSVGATHYIGECEAMLARSA